MKIKRIKSTYRKNSTKSKPVAHPYVISRREKSKSEIYIMARLVNSEMLVDVQFKKSMESDNKKRAELNAPIAKYDVVKKKAYLEYPDGRIVYAT